jgi:copper(I)-binding protein
MTKPISCSTRVRRTWLALALPVSLAVTAGEPLSISADDLTISPAWAHATPAGAETSAVYFSIENSGSQLETLLRASSPVAGDAMFARTTEHDGESLVEQIWSIDVVAGRKVNFQPEGRHVMLKALKQPLVAGTRIPLTLQFQFAGEVTMQVQILPANASGPKVAAAGPTPGPVNAHTLAAP